MSKIDDMIKELGYTKVETNFDYNFVVYENKPKDIRVVVTWDENEDLCTIIPGSRTVYHDCNGNPYREARGLNIREYSLFVEKIKEMRIVDKLSSCGEIYPIRLEDIRKIIKVKE